MLILVKIYWISFLCTACASFNLGSYICKFWKFANIVFSILIFYHLYYKIILEGININQYNWFNVIKYIKVRKKINMLHVYKVNCYIKYQYCTILGNFMAFIQ